MLGHSHTWAGLNTDKSSQIFSIPFVHVRGEIPRLRRAVVDDEAAVDIVEKVLAGRSETVLSLIKIPVPLMLAYNIQHCIRPLPRLAGYGLRIALGEDACSHHGGVEKWN